MFRPIKQYCACWCITAMLATSMWSQFPCVAGCADVNCDGLLDVLDVQAIAADVLASHPEQHSGDVNGDGRVDVRDFQVAVAELRHPPSTSDAPLPERTEPEACISCDRRMMPVLAPGQLLPVARPVCPKPRRTGAWHQAQGSNHSVERFLFHLIPNAPPCLA